jgi:hypothetical protein
MMLTKDEQKALDSTYLELHSLRTETRLSNMAAQIDAKRREQAKHPTPRKSTLELQLEAERRQKREERRKEAERMMARSRVQRTTVRPRTALATSKAFTNVAPQQRLYEVKSLLPSPFYKKRLEQEYERVLSEQGPEQAEGMLLWYQQRIGQGNYTL